MTRSKSYILYALTLIVPSLFIWIPTIFILINSPAKGAGFDTINVKTIELNPSTYLPLQLAPDLGVLLEFPFSKEDVGDFAIEQINNRFYKNTAPDKLKSSDNSFSIYLDSIAWVQAQAQNPNQLAIGDIFIRYGDYKVIIRAQSTDDPRKHTSHVIFKLSEKDQRSYIQKITDRLKQQHQQELIEVRANVDKEVKQGIIEGIVNELSAPVEFSRIGEYADTDYLEIEIIEVIEYPNYAVYRFQVDNYYTTAISVDAINADNPLAIHTQPITIPHNKTAFSSFVVEGPRIKAGTKLTISTSQGDVSVGL